MMELEQWTQIELKNTFSKIYNIVTEKELLRILRLKDPTFNNWNYLIGTFLVVGYGVNEIVTICDEYSKSEKYSSYKTEMFILNHPIYTGKGAALKNDPVPSSLVKPVFSRGIDVINHFFSNTLPVLPFIDIPKNVLDAAHFYYRYGYTPLPKHPEHKHPGIKYANGDIHYRDNRFPEDQLDLWEFKHGICLLGDTEHCYLDLDNHPGKDNGVIWFDRELLRGRHYERTKSGGYHIFGFGNLETVSSVEGVEIRGRTALIVSYPTVGYSVTEYV